LRAQLKTLIRHSTNYAIKVQLINIQSINKQGRDSKVSMKSNEIVMEEFASLILHFQNSALLFCSFIFIDLKQKFDEVNLFPTVLLPTNWNTGRGSNQHEIKAIKVGQKHWIMLNVSCNHTSFHGKINRGKQRIENVSMHVS
jgi:hypothetical protein